jgi:hypothetical protein
MVSRLVDHLRVTVRKDGSKDLRFVAPRWRQDTAIEAQPRASGCRVASPRAEPIEAVGHATSKLMAVQMHATQGVRR